VTISADESGNSYSDDPVFEPGAGGEHLEEISLDEFGPELPDAPGGSEREPGYLTKAEFFATFRGIFAAPNLFISPPLKSLDIPANDAAARAVSDQIYDLCREIHFLQWLVKPGGKYAQAVLIIAPWSISMYSSVAAEIAERKAERLAAAKAAKAARAAAPAGPEPERAAPVEPEPAPNPVTLTEG
jgi:hypothetical protein